MLALLQLLFSAGSVIWYVTAGVEALWAMPLMHACVLLVVASPAIGKHFGISQAAAPMKPYVRNGIALRAVIVCASVGLTIWSCLGTQAGQYAGHAALMALQTLQVPKAAASADSSTTLTLKQWTSSDELFPPHSENDSDHTGERSEVETV